MSKRLIALGAAFAALAIIVAGCGGGGSSTESTEQTESASALTKAEFVKKGNAICAKAEKEVEQGVEKFSREHNVSEKKGPSEKQVEELVEALLVPAVRKQLREIRGLGIPSGDEKEVEAIFAAFEEALKETEEFPSVFGKGGVGPFEKANKLSREYGLTTCGKEPQAEESEKAGAESEKEGGGLGAEK